MYSRATGAATTSIASLRGSRRCSRRARSKYCTQPDSAWVGSLTLAGYWFGNLPWIQKNLSLVILAIIAISLVPVVVGWLQNRRA